MAASRKTCMHSYLSPLHAYRSQVLPWFTRNMVLDAVTYHFSLSFTISTRDVSSSWGETMRFPLCQGSQHLPVMCIALGQALIPCSRIECDTKSNWLPNIHRKKHNAADMWQVSLNHWIQWIKTILIMESSVANGVLSMAYPTNVCITVASVTSVTITTTGLVCASSASLIFPLEVEELLSSVPGRPHRSADRVIIPDPTGEIRVVTVTRCLGDSRITSTRTWCGSTMSRKMSSRILPKILSYRNKRNSDRMKVRRTIQIHMQNIVLYLVL